MTGPPNRATVSYLDTILGQTVDLIPYGEEHVPAFNRWLQDPEMQKLVSTAALTLAEEYVYQKECVHSTDKVIKLIQRKDSALREVIGDVDLFLDGEGGAEVNIMVADGEWRRRGYGSEALLLSLQYAVQNLGVENFSAKIGADNIASLRFFERHGFHRKEPTPNVFGEYVYELGSGELARSSLKIQS